MSQWDEDLRRLLRAEKEARAHRHEVREALNEVQQELVEASRAESRAHAAVFEHIEEKMAELEPGE